MKTLLVAGAGPIFQLARVWRNEEGSDTHAPEFTLLEWYRPGASLEGLMDETEALLRAVLPPVVQCRGVRTALAAFERVTMAQAFTSAGSARRRAGHRQATPPRWHGRPAPGCATAKPGRICSSACCWSGWSRISAATTRPS